MRVEVKRWYEVGVDWSDGDQSTVCVMATSRKVAEKVAERLLASQRSARQESHDFAEPVVIETMQEIDGPYEAHGMREGATTG